MKQDTWQVRQVGFYDSVSPEGCLVVRQVYFLCPCHQEGVSWHGRHGKPVFSSTTGRVLFARQAWVIGLELQNKRFPAQIGGIKDNDAREGFFLLQ